MKIHHASSIRPKPKNYIRMKSCFKIAAIMVLVMASNSTVNAQSLVALHSSGEHKFYNGVNGFADAYNAAQPGDTIYLPGGFFNTPGNIDKRLVIFGVGHYPDSTLATEKTVVTSGIGIHENADNLHLEGLHFMGDIVFAPAHSVNNVTIKRCQFNIINYQGNYSNPCKNNLIIQNVINGWVHGENAQSLVVTNNIIAGKIVNMNTNVIQNNILMGDFYTGWPYYSSAMLMNMNNSTIKNNVILSSDLNTISGTGNIVKNNVFRIAWATGNNVVSGNYLSVDLAGFFVNQTGNVFSYGHNYHLANPTGFMGDDGTQLGIYGGAWGYVDGAVPIIPHIMSKTIAPQTNSNGELQFQIKVRTQNE